MSDAAAEIDLLRARLAASEARARTAEAELAEARAVVSTSEAMIAHLRLEIARLRREQYGRSSELRIPTEAGRVFRREAGHRSDLISATVPI